MLIVLYSIQPCSLCLPSSKNLHFSQCPADTSSWPYYWWANGTSVQKWWAYQKVQWLSQKVAVISNADKIWALFIASQQYNCRLSRKTTHPLRSIPRACLLCHLFPLSVALLSMWRQVGPRWQCMSRPATSCCTVGDAWVIGVWQQYTCVVGTCWEDCNNTAATQCLSVTSHADTLSLSLIFCCICPT